MSLNINRVTVAGNLRRRVKYDDSDKTLLSYFKWRLHTDGYAVASFYEPVDKLAPMSHTNRRHKIIRMHRLIMGANIGEEVDHINGNKLDNRRSNLRIVNSSQNKMNSAMRSDNKSGSKGVIFDKARGKWKAYIRKDKLMYNIGRYDTKTEATKARAEAEKALFGAYSRKAS